MEAWEPPPLKNMHDIIIYTHYPNGADRGEGGGGGGIAQYMCVDHMPLQVQKRNKPGDPTFAPVTIAPAMISLTTKS